jgi:hypothetical protein
MERNNHMKVKELRDTLKDKDVKLVNEAFVEVYKMLLI